MNMLVSFCQWKVNSPLVYVSFSVISAPYFPPWDGHLVVFDTKALTLLHPHIPELYKNSNNQSIHRTNLFAVKGLEARLSIFSLSLTHKRSSECLMTAFAETLLNIMSASFRPTVRGCKSVR